MAAGQLLNVNIILNKLLLKSMAKGQDPSLSLMAQIDFETAHFSTESAHKIRAQLAAEIHFSENANGCRLIIGAQCKKISKSVKLLVQAYFNRRRSRKEFIHLASRCSVARLPDSLAASCCEPVTKESK